MKMANWIGVILCVLSLQFANAQNSDTDANLTVKPNMTFHGESLSLSELARNQTQVAEGMGQLIEPEMAELFEEPIVPGLFNNQPAETLQRTPTKPLAAIAGASFEGPGTGLAGFVLTGAPPDMTLAVGPNHIVAWVNSQFAVYNKTGTVLTGPVNGSSLFAGLGNECATTNRGDPILQYDRLADRWILSQFAFAVSGGAPAAPYFQCFAISTTNDPTGSYVRYSVSFGSVSPNGFNDYGKLAVWPDAYYTSYNIFGGSPAGSNTGVALCASDRTKMLAGDSTATTLCAPTAFYGGGASFLPADLDGTTLPSDLTQGGIFIRISTTLNLRMLKLKPNFAAGTVTLGDGFGGASGSFINLPVGATTNACNGTGGSCIAQVGTTNVLDTLGTRLMYRLAFRNRGGVESMVVAHAVDPDGAGARGAAMRWYEIRNPLGNPADIVVANRPTLFQNSTYDPGGVGDRWMGSIATDRFGNIMMGYSLSNVGASLKPSIAIAGREVSDPVNTLQSEMIAFTGTGSQTGTLTRWGDYSTMQIDPVDDSTFWYIGEYLAADGSFNWRTRILSFTFPVSTTLSINDVSIVEGNSGSTNAQFTITRSNTTSAASVQVNTSNGTASAGSDYTAVTAQTINFTAGGSATATVSVPISGETVLEANETFAVNLSNPTGATVTDASGLGTISNDDSASIAIGDVTLVEGNAGSTNFVFNVTLTGEVQGGFTIPFSVADGSAVQPGDYTNNSGSITFVGTLGETQTITVAVNGDDMLESNETFLVNLGTPSNAGVSLSDASATGTISNDDSASIAISDVSLNEGNVGNTNFVFNVTLTGAVQGGFSVPFSTVNGSATQPSDYISNSGVVNFAGTAGEVQTITVTVLGDAILEANEAFTVNLSAPNNAAITVSDDSGTGAITNDDSASIAISDRTLVEGASGTSSFVFTVSLSGSVSGGFTVPFSTADATAVQPSDYASNSGTLTFAGTLGETQSITVLVVGDSILENNETFSVALGAPSVAGVTVSDGTGLGTINNDDSASIAINNLTLAEGNSGNTNFVFTVTLTGAVQGGFTVPFSSANGSAIQPSDFIDTSGTLTFVGTLGETQSITVPVVGELVVESDENFFVNLGATSLPGVIISSAQGTGLITNDDLFADVVVSMIDGVSNVVTGTNTVYTVTISNTSSLIDIATLNIAQTISAGLINLSWTCSASGGATCAPSGSGLISQSLALPKNSTVIFLITATASASPPAVVNNEVVATVTAPQTDPNTVNNIASDNNNVVADAIFSNGYE